MVCGRGEKLPFKDESFDCIISGFYSYRYVNPILGLPEARRVLKKGGRFAFDLLNYWILKLIELKRILKGGLKSFHAFQRKPSSNSFEFITFPQLKQRTEEAGFSIESIVSTPLSPLFGRTLNKHLSHFYYRGKRTVYLGYDVIIVLKAV